MASIAIRTRGPVVARWAVLIVLMVGAGNVGADERLVRRADELGQVTALAEDGDGGLWAGTAGALYRHDGRAWRRVVLNGLRGRITAIVIVSGGTIVAEEFGAVWRVPADGGAPIRLADERGRPLQGPVGVAVGDDGWLWIVDERGVRAGDPSAPRALAVPDALIAERPVAIAAAPGGGAFVATRSALWSVARDGAATRLGDAARPAALLVDRGGVLYLAHDGTLTRWEHGCPSHVYAPDPAATRARRGIAMVRRGDTLWVAYDLELVALRQGQPPEILDASDDIASGGPLLVDHEGSLWLGTFRGLRQFPEPETVALNQTDGLPSNHGRFTVTNDEGVWLVTWQGLALVPPGARHAQSVEPAGLVIRAPICVDGDGRLWVGTRNRLFMRDHGHTREIELGDETYRDCYLAGDRLWIATTTGVLVIDRGGDPVRVVTAPPAEPGEEGLDQIAVGAGTTLWISTGARVCHVSAAHADAARWTCAVVPGMRFASDLWPAPSGAAWVASRPGGVYRVDDEGVEPLPGVDRLPSPVVARLAPSPRGGVWISTAGGPRRVVEDRSAPDGWRVVEQLDTWHGLMTGSVLDVAEGGDGELWLASDAGLIAVSAKTRTGVSAPPQVEIVEAATGRVLRDRARLDLPAGRNELDLRVGATTRRAPEHVSYRFRVGGGMWSAPRPTGDLQLIDLPSGSRTIEVAASLDGERWGAPASVIVDVPTPWHHRPWPWLLLGAALVRSTAPDWQSICGSSASACISRWIFMTRLARHSVASVCSPRSFRKSPIQRRVASSPR